MAQYKLTFVVEAARVDSVTAKVKKFFGEDAASSVQKIDLNKSRADRLLDAESDMCNARSEVESLKDELQEWLDNLPENLQNGTKAEELQEAIDSLDEIYSSLDSIEFDVTFPSMM